MGRYRISSLLALCALAAGAAFTCGVSPAVQNLIERVEFLEAEIDELNRALEPLRSFILPGGTPAASFLHLARTVSRRAERLMVALASRPDEPVGDAALRYINRLSDFLFVAARHANGKGKSDVMWVPGKNR